VRRTNNKSGEIKAKTPARKTKSTTGRDQLGSMGGQGKPGKKQKGGDKETDRRQLPGRSWRSGEKKNKKLNHDDT